MYGTLFLPQNFLTPNEDCSKSFCIKTFLRIHRCLKYWESEKKFAKPLSRAFSWHICQHQIFSFFTRLSCITGSSLKLLHITYCFLPVDLSLSITLEFGCQPQALSKNPIRWVRTNLGNAKPFSLKFLSLIGFPPNPENCINFLMGLWISRIEDHDKWNIPELFRFNWSFWSVNNTGTHPPDPHFKLNEATILSK